MRKLTEYVIVYKDGEESISETKQEADDEFKHADKSQIHQYYSKQWYWANGDYQEDEVEVFYSNV